MFREGRKREKYQERKTEERKTTEMPLSQDTYTPLNCVLLLRAQTNNVCVPCNIFYLDVCL